MAFLYLLTVTAIFTRYWVEVNRLKELHAVLENRNVSILQPPLFLLIARPLTCLIGTMFALVSIYYFHERRSRDA